MSNFASVIVDCNSINWGTLISKNHETNIIEDIFSAIIALCNTHLFLSTNNKLLVLAGGAKLTNKKFVEVGKNQTTNDFAKSLEIFLRKKLEEHANYDEPASSQYSAAISLSICDIPFLAFTKFTKQYPNSTGSIIIINLAQNLSNEHSTLMNLFFASKHSSLVVNAVSLNGNVPILQQACDITNGIHVTLDNVKLLTQTILSECITISNNSLFIRPQLDIDYRAVCHCHNKLLSIGWVCSVCLSVTCNYVPFCKICNAVFPRPLFLQQKRLPVKSVPQQKRNEAS
ncbi:hypothetical protein Mgra_00003629 [Meloidogyne graminicola]|uniref:General transcription factor IIH subunit 3 n=1 Tax=Meloidogyne graminicola TaxID=189291 RepID=A0A8S9ZUF8_9BILA|nr:hypothetical protein Mgra_00003629 [Meloidogyne graminicola]